MRDDRPLDAYVRFLERYRDDPTAWRALPREVSDWWRRRAATSLRPVDGEWRASGPAEDRAAVAFVSPRSRTTAAAQRAYWPKGQHVQPT
jgi:hypothetical protein